MQKSEYSTVRLQVYNMLKSDISSGIYPPGCRLREQDLSERYQTSRNPVREALHQLASEGLVQEIPNRGAIVRQMSGEEMAELYDARVMIESYAIRHISREALAEGSPELMALLMVSEQAFRDGDLALFSSIDKKLHNAIVNLCGNSLISSFYENISASSSQFRSYALSNEGRWKQTMSEHRAMVESLLSGNSEQACLENEQHLSRAKDVVLECLGFKK